MPLITIGAPTGDTDGNPPLLRLSTAVIYGHTDDQVAHIYHMQCGGAHHHPHHAVTYASRRAAVSAVCALAALGEGLAMVFLWKLRSL